MQRSRALERLDDHQRVILSILSESAPLMAEESRDVAGLARGRWAMVRALTAYQLFLEREVFAPALARATPAAAHRVLKVKQSLREFDSAFRGHVQRWSASDVTADWAAFRPAAEAIRARIRDQLTQDRTHIAPLLG